MIKRLLTILFVLGAYVSHSQVYEKKIISVSVDSVTTKWKEIEKNKFISISVKKHFNNDSLNGIFTEYIYYKIQNFMDRDIVVNWKNNMFYSFVPKPVIEEFTCNLLSNSTVEASDSTYNREGAKLGYFVKFRGSSNQVLTDFELLDIKLFNPN